MTLGENLAFFAALVVIAVPFVLLVWWLRRNERSIDDLAAVMNETGISLGAIRLGGKVRSWLLFADVRFVVFVIRRRYREMALPLALTEALDSARSDYLRTMAIYTPLLVIAFLWAASGNR